MKRWHSITAFIMLMAVMSSFDVVSAKKISQYEYNSAANTENQMSQELELDSIFRDMPRNFSDPENIEASHKDPNTEVKSKMTKKALHRTKRIHKDRQQKYRQLDRHRRKEWDEVFEECPISWDWRKNGTVTRVKNQRKCESCWAFAITGTMESQYFIENGELVDMSEQNLIDCVKHKRPNHCMVNKSMHDKGLCNGGVHDFEDALKYITTKGIYSEDDYKYEGFNGECRQLNKPVYHCKFFYKTRKGDENDLKSVIWNEGPVAAFIDSRTLKNIGFYSRNDGIFKNPDCGGKHRDELNHAILIVGYGETSEGEKYWIVKNSWGKEPPMHWGNGVKGWEEKGYFRLAREDNNMCGITTNTRYAKNCTKLN